MKWGTRSNIFSSPILLLPLLYFIMRPLGVIPPPPLCPPCPREAPPGADVARGDDVEGEEEALLDEPEFPYLPDREPRSVSTERRSVARLTAPRSLPDTTRGETVAPLALLP